ncbi:sulfatase-like hydrolase/transferase [Reichenbachiella versicolor]|uniref:sulfatase-like hydrolase/transferase n=1 Tax=Reichenbachiella versicolor TaxID=1821036 RepID=UPI000D6E7ED7|nr:sulfatase-like hydrolase/transferase [Reichenbachiella versicolor]
MKVRTILMSVVGIITVVSNTFAKTTKKSKPNIIVVFADDISAREFPIYGSDTWSSPEAKNTSDVKYRAKTPVLDKIAKEGCYVKTAWASVVCSPSRAMMMTGRYAHLHKWWENKSIGQYTNEKGKAVAYPFYESSPKTIGAIAKEGGYATIWAGKTQMRGADLSKFGFDEGVFTPGPLKQTRLEPNSFTDFRVEIVKENGHKRILNMDTGEEMDTYAQNSWYWKPHVMLMNHPSSKGKKYEWWPNTPESKEAYGTHTYGPDVELDFILDFMERKTNDKMPFFVYHTTHLGHDAMNFVNPKETSKWPGTPKIKWTGKEYVRTQPKITGDNGNYDTHGTITEPGIHTHINYLDYQMWQYLNKLDDLGIMDNTIIIFCADNGTGKYGKNSPDIQKGVHVPFMVYAPGLGMTKKGFQDVLVNIADVLPTVAELAGVDIPADYEMNGVSLIPFLTTNKPTHREWIYGYKGSMQIIRNDILLKDGRDKWYDVRENPKDLISFPQITDWNMASSDLKQEKEKLLNILPQFDKFDEEQHGPLSPANKTELKELARRKAMKKKKAKALSNN